jgi:hypothetical protein
MYASGIALVATVGLMDPAMAQDASRTPSENFNFEYDTSSNQEMLTAIGGYRALGY